MSKNKKWEVLSKLEKMLKFSDDSTIEDIKETATDDVENIENVENVEDQPAESPKDPSEFEDVDDEKVDVEVDVKEDKSDLFATDEELMAYIKTLEDKIAELESKLVQTVEVVEENFRKISKSPAMQSSKFKSQVNLKKLSEMTAYEKYMYNKNK